MAIDNEMFKTLLGNERKPTASIKIFDVIDAVVDKETEHKADTNLAQSGHKTKHKPITKWTQTEHKKNTGAHKQKETEHKPNTKVGTKSDTKRTQTEHKLNTNTSVSSLVGLQRKTLNFLFTDCKLRGTKFTRELTLLHIAENLEIPMGSVKTTLKRLEEKSFIKRIAFKNGRGGWSKYELLEEVYKELIHTPLELKLDTNRTQSGYKPNTKLNTQPDTSLSSSSGSYNYINTTTTEDITTPEKITAATLSSEWLGIDIEPLASIGFTITHLTQIVQSNKTSPDLLQDSINAFAFDLDHNHKAQSIKGNPLNFFMGIVRNGKPYAPPGNYESPEDKAMRLYLEQKKKIADERAVVEKELQQLAFLDWEMELSEEAIATILPNNMFKTTSAKQSLLRNHFAEEVWPNQRKKILAKMV